MNLQHSPDGSIDHRILKAVSTAIRSIEVFTRDIDEYEITEEDAELLFAAQNYLRAILENNGYTINFATNRLRRAKP